MPPSSDSMRDRSSELTTTCRSPRASVYRNGSGTISGISWRIVEWRTVSPWISTSGISPVILSLMAARAR